MTHYPVFTLTAVAVVGCIIAIAVLLAGFVWPAVLVFVATILILCWLIAIMIRRQAH